MPGKQSVYCSACKIKHSRPVGRNCKRTTDSMVSTGLLVAASPERLNATSNATSSNLTPDVSQQILSKLVGLSDQISAIDRHVQHNEQAIAQQSSVVQYNVPQSTPSVPTGPSVAAVRLPVDQISNPGPSSQLVPSVDYLKSNQAIQSQVDSRVQELHQRNEGKGKLFSQRGGGAVHRYPLKDTYHGHKTMS